jgi:hypothetical protein
VKAVLALQHLHGNQAVTRMLAGAHAAFGAGALKVQRAVWTYGDDNRWTQDGAQGGGGAQQPVGLPQGQTFAPGDKFDDATHQLYSGRNAQAVGEPNRLFGYADPTDQDAAALRKALAGAKLKLAKAVTVLQGEKATLEGGQQASAKLKGIMSTAFNVPDNAAIQEQLRVVTILAEGLGKLETGLNLPNLVLSSATRMRAYIFGDEAADCSGWVPRYLTERSGLGAPLGSADDLKALSGEIHLLSSGLNDTNFVADTIIHEGTHKFLGTWDYSYIGIPGSVGTGLQNKANVISQANPNLTQQQAAAQARTESHDRAYAQRVQEMVNEEIRQIYPIMLRGRPFQKTDSPELNLARSIWSMVGSWGQATVPIPTAVQLNNVVTNLIQLPKLPGSLRSSLQSFQANPEQFLASKGNELRVKGHDVLFALSSGYLLKNADSWTELVLQLP